MNQTMSLLKTSKEYEISSNILQIEWHLPVAVVVGTIVDGISVVAPVTDGKTVGVAGVLAVVVSGTLVEVTDVVSLVVLGTDVVVAVEGAIVVGWTVVDFAAVVGAVVEVAPVEIVAVVVSTIIDHNISINFFELSWKSRIEYT